jgi:hypothetical protein
VTWPGPGAAPSAPVASSPHCFAPLGVSYVVIRVQWVEPFMYTQLVLVVGVAVVDSVDVVGVVSVCAEAEFVAGGKGVVRRAPDAFGPPPLPPIADTMTIPTTMAITPAPT